MKRAKANTVIHAITIVSSVTFIYTQPNFNLLNPSEDIVDEERLEEGG